MATIKNIERTRNWAKRPTDKNTYANDVWFVKEGEEYDLVQFSINELKSGYLWPTHLCVPCDWTDRKIKKVVEKIAKEIKEEEINDFQSFLEMGEKWGWD